MGVTTPGDPSPASPQVYWDPETSTYQYAVVVPQASWDPGSEASIAAQVPAVQPLPDGPQAYLDQSVDPYPGQAGSNSSPQAAPYYAPPPPPPVDWPVQPDGQPYAPQALPATYGGPSPKVNGPSAPDQWAHASASPYAQQRPVQATQLREPQPGFPEAAPLNEIQPLPPGVPSLQPEDQRSAPQAWPVAGEPTPSPVPVAPQPPTGQWVPAEPSAYAQPFADPAAYTNGSQPAPDQWAQGDPDSFAQPLLPPPPQPGGQLPAPPGWSDPAVTAQVPVTPPASPDPSRHRRRPRHRASLPRLHHRLRPSRPKVRVRSRSCRQGPEISPLLKPTPPGLSTVSFPNGESSESKSDAVGRRGSF
jgi:hypothetical protein